jgi:hypothetical protein
MVYGKAIENARGKQSNKINAQDNRGTSKNWKSYKKQQQQVLL